MHEELLKDKNIIGATQFMEGSPLNIVELAAINNSFQYQKKGGATTKLKHAFLSKENRIARNFGRSLLVCLLSYI